jgi:hypothetical protein
MMAEMEWLASSDTIRVIECLVVYSDAGGAGRGAGGGGEHGHGSPGIGQVPVAGL